MWKKVRWLIPLFVILVLILGLLVGRIGREKLPTQQLTTAEKTLTEAKEKEADLYAQDLFQQAQESLERAKDLSREKKYKEAREAAEAAARLAEQAISQAGQNRLTLKSEVEQRISDVRKGIDELKELVSNSRKKMAKRERRELGEKVRQWEKGVAEVESLIEADRIRQAYDRITALKKEVGAEHGRFIPSPEEKQGIK